MVPFPVALCALETVTESKLTVESLSMFLSIILFGTKDICAKKNDYIFT